MKIKFLENAAWITWEVQIRNRSMAEALGIPLHELISNRSRLFRYFDLTIRTLAIIRKKRLEVLFVQSPSLVLSFLAICIQSVFGIKVVVDAHNSGIYPLEGNSIILGKIAKYITQRATLVIVSNEKLAEAIRRWGSSAFVMKDPLPNLKRSIVCDELQSKPYMLFICTWANDEPYYEVIKAAKKVEQKFDIYITGNYKKRLPLAQIEALPKNVKLLGFVPESVYIDYFSSSVAAIDLTTREDCLVCGAYEALALGIPAIISKSEVNREAFPKGFVYSENTAESIEESMLTAYNCRADLKHGIEDTRVRHLAESEDKARKLLSFLEVTEQLSIEFSSPKD